MNTKEFVQSQTFKGILVGLVLAIIGLIIFQAGVVVGEHRSNFTRGFGDTFERNFRGPEGGMMFRGFPNEGPIPNGYGAVGKVISIALPDVIVAGPDNLEKTVIIDSETVIREFQMERTANDLEVGDHVVALGEPNEEGQIEAKLIRLLPPPPVFGEGQTNQ